MKLRQIDNPGMIEKSTKINFPAPVFSSRVSRARMLIELSGKRFVWDAARGKYVLTDKRKAKRQAQHVGR